MEKGTAKTVKRMVITGPTGAIGMAMIQACIKKKIEVLAICHRGSKRIGNIPEHPLVRVLELDLNEYRTYEPVENREYDAFFHFAWNGTFGNTRNDMELQVKNVEYTLDAVKLAKKLGCHTFIGAGSQAEYGRVEGVLGPDTPTFPENGYGMAKLCAGQMSRTLCEQLHMRHIWTRILSVYGPYDGAGTMIMSSIRKMTAGETAQFTKGEQMWDYLYSEDAADAFLALLEKGIHGKIYCLGSGNAAPLAQYIQIMYKKTKAKGLLELGAIPYAEKQVMHLEADISELQKDVGFWPKVDFEDGIERTIAWYRSMKQVETKDVWIK